MIEPQRTVTQLAAPRTRRTWMAAAAALCALSLATPALAGGFLGGDRDEDAAAKPSWAVPAKRMPVEGDGAEAMAAQLENGKMRVQEAQQNVTMAEHTYTRSRARRYPRGEALQEIRNRVVEMKKERDDAERDFVALVDEARMSGVPAGTLMPYMDLADSIRRGQSSGGR